MPTIAEMARLGLMRRPNALTTEEPVPLKNTRSKVNARKNHIVALVRSKPQRLADISRELGYKSPTTSATILKNLVNEGRLTRSGVYYTIPNSITSNRLPMQRKNVLVGKVQIVLNYLLNNQNSYMPAHRIATAVGYKRPTTAAHAVSKLVAAGMVERYKVPGDGGAYRYRATKSVSAQEGLEKATRQEVSTPMDRQDTPKVNEEKLLSTMEALGRDCFWATGDDQVRQGIQNLLKWARGSQ